MLILKHIYLILFSFLLVFNASSQCVGNQTYTINPAGPYNVGQVVTVTYTLNSFTQFNINWIIAFDINLGNGWTNLTPLSTPSNPNTNNSSGTGYWQWDLQNTYPSGLNFGPGWRFVNTAGVSNDWGSSSTGPFTMSFQATVGQFCTAEDLSIEVSVIGDCQTGGWSNGNCCPIVPFSIYSGVIDNLLSLNATSNDVSCNGFADGEISLNISGGSIPYNVSWSNGFNTSIISNLTPGTYNVTVTDDIGCVSTLNNILINEPSPITISTSPDQFQCEGTLPSQLFSFPSSNGNNYNWTPSSYFINANVQNPVFNSILTNTTTYIVNFVDNNGCIASDSVTINIIPTLTTQPISHN